MPLAQRRQRDQRKTQRLRDGLRRLPCAHKIAAVERVGLPAEKVTARGSGLGLAGGVEREVEMTLHALLDIPVGLAVADETNPCCLTHQFIHSKKGPQATPVIAVLSGKRTAVR